jgi:hypothetical protein
MQEYFSRKRKKSLQSSDRTVFYNARICLNLHPNKYSMLEKLKSILASTIPDAQKVEQVRALVDRAFTYDQLLDSLRNAVGKPRAGNPWDGMSGEEMRALLFDTESIPRKEWVHIDSSDKDALASVLDHWCIHVKIDAGNHIVPTSPLGKGVYNLKSATGRNNAKPETVQRIINELGLDDGFQTIFLIDDGLRPGQQVRVGGKPAQLIEKPNIYQWWVVAIENNTKKSRLVEVRDIQKIQ